MATADKPLSRGILMRLLVEVPLLLSAAGATLVLVLAPGTWGAANDVGLAPWAPMAGLLIVALPILALAAWAMATVWRRATGLFEVDLTWAAVGTLVHWLAAMSLVLFAGTAGSKDSYQSLGADSTSTAGFIFLAMMLCALFDGIIGALTMVYVWSIEPGPRTKIAQRDANEVDFVKEWTRRKRRPRI